jgi:hypothetical protein
LPYLQLKNYLNCQVEWLVQKPGSGILVLVSIRLWY